MTDSPELPPRVPTELADLQRALALLGSVTQAGGRLKDKAKKELVALIGVFPSQQQAALWKRSLKELAREVREETAAEASGEGQPDEPTGEP